MEAQQLWNGYVAREEWMQRNLDNAQELLNDMHKILLEHEKMSDVLNLRNSLVQRTPTKVYLSYRLDLETEGKVLGVGFDAMAATWFVQEEGESSRLQGQKEDIWDHFLHQAFCIHQRDHNGQSLMSRLLKSDSDSE